MARLGSFDVAGRVDNTSMLVGTEIHKKVASAKNYKINAVRRFMLEGLAPETGGLLKYHEIGYDGDAYSTPYDFVNDIGEDIDILRYHILVVRINEDKFLFTRQGVSIGANSEAVEEEDFIALNGISAGTIRQLVSDLANYTEAEIANLHQILDETSLNQSDSLLGERNSRIAAVNVLSQALTTESTARAALSTSVNAAIQSETSAREAAVNTLNQALVTESTARATLSTNINATIQDEISDRQASVDALNEALVTESTARAILATELNAAINDETSAREALVHNLSESIVAESIARASLGTILNATIEDEVSAREAAVTTLNQSIVNESSARATLGTNLTAAIGTETTNRQAAITTLNTAIANETTARTTAVTNLNAAINTEKTSREAAVTTLQQADTTEAATRAALGTTLTAAIATEATNRAAAITTLNTAITDEASTRASAITGLTTTVTNNYNTLSSNITAETTARTTAISTVTGSINTLTSTVNGNTAAITTAQNTLATVDGKLSASYGLSVDAGGRIASMKLLSNGATSQIAFTADSFKIYNGTSNVAPFTVVNGQVKMTGVTTADTLITPGNGPAYPAAGWNGLSVNRNNDNALRFRHANGTVGIEIGIIGGQLTLNWYNDQGTLVWKGGSAGIVYIDNIPESWTPRQMGIISATIGENPSPPELSELETLADQLLIFTNGGGEAVVGGSSQEYTAYFPVNKVTVWEYAAGTNAQTAANRPYEGYHPYQYDNTAFIQNGWWAYYSEGKITQAFTENGEGNTYLSLVYIKNGKISSNVTVSPYRLGTGVN